MKPESIAFTIAGMCFGVILGWVIGTQQAGGGREMLPPQAAVAPAAAPTQRMATPLDESLVRSLTQRFEQEPGNVEVALDLANVYSESQRWEEAIAWYERALAIEPGHQRAMLNKGIVLAFGREDLRGATEMWKQVVQVSADTPEGEMARRLLEGVATAHAGDAGLPGNP
jgi:Flp pilus assembly protein TadD